MMGSDPKGVAVVLMGVCGSGKSTIGEMLAKEVDCCFLDADNFHPQANKEKMCRGIPLTDEDRAPWLETLQHALREFLLNGQNVILGCSALQTPYREILRSADPYFRAETCIKLVKFVLLEANAEVLTARLEKRTAEGKHFMPASLLRSQLDLLQIDDSEGIHKVDATQTPESLVNTIKALIF